MGSAAMSVEGHVSSLLSSRLFESVCHVRVRSSGIESPEGMGGAVGWTRACRCLRERWSALQTRARRVFRRDSIVQ